MRAFVILDGLWVGALFVFGGLVYHEGAERASLKANADTIRKDLAQIERAIGRWAERQSLPTHESVPFEVYAKYLEGGSSRLRKEGLDPLGNAYGVQTISGPPTVPAASVERLRDVVDRDFWEPYEIAKP